MRQCLNCETTLRPGQATCPRCGAEVEKETRKYSGEKPQQAPDPMYGCCDWVGDGRCHYPGVFGHGQNGPYYCRGHENCNDPILGAQIVSQSHRDIPRPDYSFQTRRAASEAKLRRDMEAWNNRLGSH